jgi:hypothetical protein
MTDPRAMRLPVVDGRIAHANGFLELKLQGDARSQAHADIMSFVDPVGRANGKQLVYNRSIGNIVRQDPSLLLEPIPARYPVVRTSKESWANADTVWKNYNTWYGNWLTRVLDPAIACDEAVEHALEAGIHPDDATVWPTGTLLSSEGWATNPRRLSLALRYGASPDLNGGEWHDGYLRQALNMIRFAMTDSSKAQEMRDGIRCAHLLLDAGAVTLDPPPAPPSKPSEMNLAAKLLSAIGYLTDGNGVQMLKPELRDQVHELAVKLQRAGADIDRPNGPMELPPVVQALRCLNIDFACQLIRMGCKTVVHTVKRSHQGGGPEPLEVEAYKAGKEAFVTRVLEAQMERQIAQADSRAPANDSVADAPRRRLRAV